MRGGPVRIAADGVVGPSGKPIRVYGVVIVSGGGGAGSVILYNGTDTNGQIYLTGAGSAASKADLIANIPAEGMLFPSGCFADIGTNTDALIVHSEVVSKA